MNHDLSLDIKVARLKAGLTQSDCVHLLGVQKNRMSQIEKKGKAPTLREAVLLSIILNRRFDEIFTLEQDAAFAELAPRLESLPDPEKSDPHTFNRIYTLSAVAERVTLCNERQNGS
jgi:DNA-binding XRE family transcriptional regulator